MPNQEPAIAWPFRNGPVRVVTQGLFRLCLKTFVAPFLPARLTAPGSPRMENAFTCQKFAMIVFINRKQFSGSLYRVYEKLQWPESRRRSSCGHFPDSGLHLLKGFDFYFDLFWKAWDWKPAIVHKGSLGCQIHKKTVKHVKLTLSQIKIQLLDHGSLQEFITEMTIKIKVSNNKTFGRKDTTFN